MIDSDIRALYMSAAAVWMHRWVEVPTVERDPVRRDSSAPDVGVLDEDDDPLMLRSIRNYCEGYPDPRIFTTAARCGAGI